MGKVKSKLSKEEIARKYEDGRSTLEISIIAEVSQRRIRTILNETGAKKRPFGSWKRKYQLNEDYFKVWSNNMAYILGFFVADGTISNQTQNIIFAQKDSNILLKIRKELRSNQPLYLNKKTKVYLLTINSKIIKQDLLSIHGITSNKSKTIQFPNVPKEYLSHFIRGYFIII